MEETRRLQAITETIRAEAASADPYVRRMRPTFGYVAAATWGVQGLAIAAAITVAIAWPERSGGIFEGLTALMRVLSEPWLYALAVLGVYVWKRSGDKKPAGEGMLTSIARRIRGG